MTTLIYTINDILTAGVAITAFSLFLYSLAFNLRNRVALSFAMVLLCVVVVYSTEAIAGNSDRLDVIEVLMFIQWLGIIWLPAAYTRFSKALLSTTGIQIRQKIYFISTILSSFFTLLLFSGLLLGNLVQDQSPAPHLQPTIWSTIFAFYYGFSILISLYNVNRARQRTRTHSTHRRLTYLLIGCMAPGIGSFPYLVYGNMIAEKIPSAFWLLAISLNAVTGIFIVIMAYSIAFFGVTYPDRVVKNRLARWLLRGPITAVITLGIVTVVRRIGEKFGVTYSAFVPISMVASLLLLEYLITLFGNRIQYWVFNGKNNKDLQLIESLQYRLVTQADLEQLLEMTLAAIRDLTRASAGVIYSSENGDLTQVINSGIDKNSNLFTLTSEEVQNLKANPETAWGFKKDTFTLFPLFSQAFSQNLAEDTPTLTREFIGILALENIAIDELEEEQDESFSLLVERIEIALNDRNAQKSIFTALRRFSPELDRFQELRANSSLGAETISILSNHAIEDTDQLSKWVKEALTHYWGGPKLSENPLNNFEIVKSKIDSTEKSTSNALRNVLQTAIIKMKPEGQHQYTTEWLLYNILQMKFLDGKKVREIASQLSISEADFYRKQRVAVEELAKIILQMENDHLTE